jgi:hypothetical protein
VDVAQAAKVPAASALSTDIRNINSLGVSNEGVFDLPESVHQDSNLAAKLPAQAREVGGQLRGDDSVLGNTPPKRPLKGLLLVCFESAYVSGYRFNLASPAKTPPQHGAEGLLLH